MHQRNFAVTFPMSLITITPVSKELPKNWYFRL